MAAGGGSAHADGLQVLVTGARSGIGQATAVHLARLGFAVVATVRDEADVDGLQRSARGAGVDIEVVVLDVADPVACARLARGREWYALVNNAAFFNVGLVEEVPLEAARRQLETMVLGPMHLAREVLPAMRARGSGRIVNVSSGIVHAGWALTGWYQAAKSALSALSDAMRSEVADTGIEVILVEPGAIRTDIWRKAEQDLRRRGPTSRAPKSYARARRILRLAEPHMRAPSTVAEVIGDALTAARPRRHYRVGAEVFALRAVGRLPYAVRDRVLRLVLGL